MDLNKEAAYIIGRLINETQTAEGSIVPLRVVAGSRVPTVSNLKVSKIERIERGTQVTLTWDDIEPFDRISHYIVSSVEYSTITQNVIGSNVTRQSPIRIRILGDEDVPITFTVQTVLLNGQSSKFENSPSVSTRTIADFVEPGDQVQSYQFQAPVASRKVLNATGSNTFFNVTGGGKLVGIGFRTTVAPTTGADKVFSIQFSIDGAAATTLVVTTGNLVWDPAILAAPGIGNMTVVADQRYVPLDSVFNTSATVTTVIGGTPNVSEVAEIETIVYYEKTV